MKTIINKLTIKQLKQKYEDDPRRLWSVKRLNDYFDGHNFDMLFFREVVSTCLEDNTEKHQLQTLIPLNQYLAYMEIDLTHSDKLIEGFFRDNQQSLDVIYEPDCYKEIIAINPNKAQFLSYEVSYESFIYRDLVPIYIVNKCGECTVNNFNDIVSGDFYVQLEHLIFIEFVCRSYSMFVKSGEFAKAGFLDVWDRYLTLMQENATSENLEEIHRAFWISQCPELANLNQTTNSIN